MANNIPISDQAMRVILNEPYNFPSRAKENLNAVRAGSKAYIEQKLKNFGTLLYNVKYSVNWWCELSDRKTK